jgi:hypothetical protein
VSQTQPGKRDALGMLRECDSCMAVEDFEVPLNLILGYSVVPVNLEEQGIALLAAMPRHGLTSSCKGSFDNWLQAHVLELQRPKSLWLAFPEGPCHLTQVAYFST